MAAATKFQQFVEDMAAGVHDFTSDATCTVTVALCNAANAPVVTNSILGNLTVVSYTNLSARVVTGITADHTTGTVDFTATNLVLTASGTVAGFRYIVLFNDDPTSPADPLIEFYDYGEDLVLLDTHTLTLNFTTGNFATLT